MIFQTYRVILGDELKDHGEEHTYSATFNKEIIMEYSEYINEIIDVLKS